MTFGQTEADLHAATGSRCHGRGRAPYAPTVMPPQGTKVVATNRRARYDYDLLERHEAGIVLRGSEVKSLRDGAVTLREGFARVDDGELWLYGVHIAPYSHAQNQADLDPDRARKLLLHRNEIDRLAQRIAQDRLTVVPTALYFSNGVAKVELALARGRRKADKRRAIAERDAAREAERAIADARRRGR